MSDKAKQTILVVDDEQPIRKALRYHLEDLNYTVLEADGGRKCLYVYERERPNLILLDLRMPDLDGLDVLAKIRERDSDTPIIIVSGVSAVADAIFSLRKGAWDYLLKPIDDLSILQDSIEKCLEHYCLIRESRLYHKKIIESEEMHRGLIENADSAIVYFDIDHKVVLANSYAARYFIDFFAVSLRALRPLR